MATLTVLMLSDGRPGHFHCSEGLIAAVRRLRPLEVTTLRIDRPWFAPPGALAALTNRGVSPAVILKRVYGLDPKALPRGDVIVSSGGDTLAANIALARLTGLPNLFFGSLRHHQPSDFALALNSYTEDEAAPNQVMILKPSPADPAALPTPALDHRRLPNVSGLLIGGNAGTIRFSQTDWDQLLAFLDDTRVRLGMAWIVSNSRRTPAAVSDRLQALSARAASPIRRFVDVRSTGHGTLGALFEASGAVVVTADSSAMLSEAIWMRRPVVAVRPAEMTLPAKEVAYRDWLQRSGWCGEIALADLTAERYASVLREVVPLAENPQTKLARVLADALPGLFAPLPQPG